jgi:hypothetical protein
MGKETVARRDLVSISPFRLMDRVGLDVVLAIEEHYASVRDGQR